MRCDVLSRGLLAPILVLAGLVLSGCPEDKSPGFECNCEPGQVCRNGVCVDPDAGDMDAGDMGDDEFIDNPECPGSGIVINEFVYTPESGAPEWVEIFGPSDRDLTGFRLVGINGNGGSSYFDITLEGSLGGAGQFLIASATVPGADQLSEDLVMQNGPDSVVLQDCGGQVVDAVGYGTFSETEVFAGRGSSAPSTSTGESLARCPGAVDTRDNAADFHISIEPTPDAENANFEDPFACEPCIGGLFDDEVVISEVLYDPDGTDTTSNEFVELNASADLDLFGLTVEWVNGSNGEVYMRRNLSGVVGSDGLFVIGGPAPDAELPGTMQNGPDSLRLVDCEGSIVDALGYGNFGDDDVFAGEGTPAPGSGAAKSLARCADGSDSDDNATDFYAATPTPGAANTGFVDPLACGGTTCLPGLHDGRLFINEIATGSGGFVELVGDPNIGVSLVEIDILAADGTLVDTLDLEGSTDANGFVTIDTDDLAAAGGTVSLLDCEEVEIDALAYGTGTGLAGEGAAAPAPGSGQSLARCADFTDTDDNETDFHLTSAPTRNTENSGFVDSEACQEFQCTAGLLDGVVINEVFPDPSGTDSTDTEFLELKGPSGVDLTEATLEFVNGANNTVYMTVELAGRIGADGLFQLGGPVGTRDQALPSTIQNDEESVRLLDCEEVAVDAVAWGEFSGEHAGERDPAPEPNDGDSIVRCPDADDTDDNSVDFVLTSTPTPGAENDVPECAGPCEIDLRGLVIINEFLDDEPGSDATTTVRFSFVELRGSTAVDVDLTGARLEFIRGDRSTEEFDSTFTLTGLLPADGYFAIGESGLPNLDQEANLNIRNNKGNIRLVDCLDHVVDAVGYGSFGVDDYFAGEPIGTSAFAVPTPSPQGVTIGRCPTPDYADADNDNNLNDFRSNATPPGLPDDADYSGIIGVPNPACE